LICIGKINGKKLGRRGWALLQYQLEFWEMRFSECIPTNVLKQHSPFNIHTALRNDQSQHDAKTAPPHP